MAIMDILTWADKDEALNKYATLQMSKKKFYKIIGKDFLYFDKHAARIKNAEKLRSQNISERNLEVLYIVGASGSGKTTLAKWLADHYNYDYFVSGSGEDFLDGYDKEECIILDDFRGGSMRFSELLKFLDNNTNSSIRSRYYNKDISNCKFIIITSVIEPCDLYKTFKEEDSNEPIEQLYRRLKHHILYINDNGEILDCKLDSDRPDYLEQTGRGLGNIDKVYKELGIDINKVDDTSILEDLYKEANESRINGFVF